MRHLLVRSALAAAAWTTFCASVDGRQASPIQGVVQGNGVPAASASVVVPADYVIGPEDVLSIVFWREKEMSTDVVVRPDGKISVPLLKDMQAAGYTPDQLTTALVKAASKFIGQPNATVVVKAINSRKVFIVGKVAKPGAFALTTDMTVLQLIALAGDVLEYAKSKNVVVVRKTDDGEQRLKFNYKDVLQGKAAAQNILLKPGDTVIVP
jgi:polysaccharide biosynthesis/export protein